MGAASRPASPEPVSAPADPAETSSPNALNDGINVILDANSASVDIQVWKVADEITFDDTTEPIVSSESNVCEADDVSATCKSNTMTTSQPSCCAWQ